MGGRRRGLPRRRWTASRPRASPASRPARRRARSCSSTATAARAAPRSCTTTPAPASRPAGWTCRRPGRCPSCTGCSRRGRTAARQRRRGDGELRLAHQADVVTRALAGHPVATDASHALKSGYDAARGAWPEELARELGDLLPAVVAPGTRLGEVCATAAEQTGLPAGTPIVAGMTDGCAAQIAAGALRPGDWNSVLGTTLVLKGCAPRAHRGPRPRRSTRTAPPTVAGCPAAHRAAAPAC